MCCTDISVYITCMPLTKARCELCKFWKGKDQTRKIRLAEEDLVDFLKQNLQLCYQKAKIPTGIGI